MGIKHKVFEFKQLYYLTELASREFNFWKTAKELQANRGDIRNHVGNKEQARNLAKELNIISG